MTSFSWLETGPEAGTLELNCVSESFFFNAVCTPLASEPNTGRDLDSDVAKIPVESKTQRKCEAYGILKSNFKDIMAERTMVWKRK